MEIRPIDANALVEGIEELKRSPWYNGENGNYERLVRADAIGTVVDLCIKAAPTLDYAPVQKVNGNTSDGYHTFNELYHHRALLFSVIVSQFKDIAWKSKLHHDGTMYDGMFIVGVNTLNGHATYHYDVEPYWDMFDCKELEHAPEWDGHTAEQAIERIASLRLLEPFKAHVEHGEWIEPDYVYFGAKRYVCKRCKDDPYWNDRYHNYRENFCPNCGAKMDGGKNDG